MLTINNGYLKIWKIEDKGKSVVASCSTSEKDRQNEGEYINSNWNVRFVGKCLEDAKQLSEGDRVKIVGGKITNVWDKENKRNWLNVVVFEFESLEDNRNNMQSNDDEELPF